MQPQCFAGTMSHPPPCGKLISNRIAAPREISNVLMKGPGEELCGTLRPARTQFVGVRRKAFGNFDWGKAQELVEKLAQSVARIGQRKFLTGQQQEDQRTV